MTQHEARTVDSAASLGEVFSFFEDFFKSNPTKANYMFDGWYDGTGAEKYTAQTPIVKVTTLTARWLPVNPTPGTFRDTRDGYTYNTVKLGNTTWMAENLRFNATGSRCFEDWDTYCETYGRLYNWETAMASCPQGWHLATEVEWGDLAGAAGGTGGPFGGITTGTDGPAGKVLKSASGWDNNGNGTDDFGFKALPGGLIDDTRLITFGVLAGANGNWWTATEGYWRTMSSSANNVGAYSTGATDSRFFSVRCVQD